MPTAPHCHRPAGRAGTLEAARLSSNATSTIYQLGGLREAPDTEQSRDSTTAPLLPLLLVHSVERKRGQSLESPPALQRRQRE